MALTPRVMELLRNNGQEHVKIFIGGIIPDEDLRRLMEMGVTGVYGPGANTENIIRDIKAAVPV
jgi:methylmalonyl-CoA mutase C-terminal domain/subunit